MGSNHSFYALDDFAQVVAGQPYRLLPFGVIHRNGKQHNITPEYALQFKLPHFKPAIKLGGHRDDQPAGGFIRRLEVREDGLYAVPEHTDEGVQALAKGSFRYHSPEILWDGFVEDAVTGEKIEGPIIMGDALLHNPALGESVALFSVDQFIYGGDQVSDNTTVSVPVSWLERFFLGKKEQEQAPVVEAPVEPAINRDDYVAVTEFDAVKAEKDELAAKIATMEAAQSRADRVAHFEAELGDGVTEEIPSLLAGLAPEVAEPLTIAIKALLAQRADLTADIGSQAPDATGDPKLALDSAIKAKQAGGLTYPQAFEVVQREQPEIVRAAYGG